MYLQIKFHGPLKYSFRPLNKGAWHIDTSLDDAFLCKGLKGIQLYILEKIIDLHQCITSKYHKIVYFLHLL